MRSFNEIYCAIEFKYYSINLSTSSVHKVSLCLPLFGSLSNGSQIKIRVVSSTFFYRILILATHRDAYIPLTSPRKVRGTLTPHLFYSSLVHPLLHLDISCVPHRDIASQQATLNETIWERSKRTQLHCDTAFSLTVLPIEQTSLYFSILK